MRERITVFATMAARFCSVRTALITSGICVTVRCGSRRGEIAQFGGTEGCLLAYDVTRQREGRLIWKIRCRQRLLSSRCQLGLR